MMMRNRGVLFPNYLSRFSKEKSLELEVDIYSSASEFLFAFSKQYSLLLLDIEMPEMDAYIFNAWIVVLLFAGVVVYLVAQLFKIRPVNALSYICYLISLGLFLRYQIDEYMDTIVDPQQGLGAVTPLFFVIIVFSLQQLALPLLHPSWNAIRKPNNRLI